MQVDPNCREDADYSILISGEILEPLVATVAPRILELRAMRIPRITVYINSVGGRIDQADALEGLLSCPSPDEYRPWIITVAFGDAKSAAATLLAMGDYAIAYPNASIHFHGARFFGEFEVTTEFANATADDLQRRNLKIAMKLADKSVKRSVLRYATLREEFQEIRDFLKKPEMTEIACFAFALHTKVRSASARSILNAAQRYSEEINELGQHVFAAIEGMEGESAAAYEGKILKSIIDYETAKLDDPSGGLQSECVSKIISDYTLLRDYHRGAHKRDLRSLINRHGRMFLTGDEIKRYNEYQAAPDKERDNWFEATVWPRMQPFWYFVICVWRSLQQEENPLSPSDAYWLGVVDEVAGTQLAAHRLAMELSDEEPDEEVTDLSTAQPPPG